MARVKDAKVDDTQAAAELLPLILDELSKLAAQKVSLQPAGQTLQAKGILDYESIEVGIIQELADRGLDGGVTAWVRSVTALSRWEQEHLLDGPISKTLPAHRRTVEQLIRLGRYLARATKDAKPSDAATKDSVAETLETLLDMLLSLQGTMHNKEAGAIAEDAFPE